MARSTFAGGSIILLTALAALVGLPSSAVAQDSAAPASPVKMEPLAPPNGTSQEAAPAADAAGVSPAEQAFRAGVDLYKKNMFNEALNEFNRALALDAGHQGQDLLPQGGQEPVKLV
jgi:hypothetical protein